MNEENFEKLFRNLKETEVPKWLELRILEAVYIMEKRAARVRAFVFSAITAVSFACSIRALAYLAEKIEETGFWQYITLLFSGDGAVYSYWRELMFSLAESLPALGFIALFAAVGLFIWSLANAIANASKGVKFGPAVFN